MERRYIAQIILLLLLVSCASPETEYGRDINNYRTKHGVSIIEDDMELVECVRNVCSWRSTSSDDAHHFRKIVWPSGDPKKWREEDHYIKKVNDSISITILVNAIFDNDSVDWETYPPSYMVADSVFALESKNITIEQVDSVLSLWNLRR